MNPIYDKIGLNYANLRAPDIRIVQRIEVALGEAISVLNVWAGAGSYEPGRCQVTAIEPSLEMNKQCTASGARVLHGRAEALPFKDKSIDGPMAILTIHNWSNQEKGVTEKRRVIRDKLVFLTFDPGCKWFWLADYFPALVTLDEKQMPPMPSYEKWLGPVKISPVSIPHDCRDGFLAGHGRNAIRISSIGKNWIAAIGWLSVGAGMNLGVRCLHLCSQSLL